jgi:hypothetical protein
MIYKVQFYLMAIALQVHKFPFMVQFANNSLDQRLHREHQEVINYDTILETDQRNFTYLKA